MRFGWLRDKQGEPRIYGWTNDQRLFLRVFGVGTRFEVGRIRGLGSWSRSRSRSWSEAQR